MQYRVLGPLRVIDSTGDITPTGDRQRRLLVALVLELGDVVPADRLLELVWGDAQPDDGAAALQSQVFRLRKLLPSGVIETVAGGYRLNADRDDVDAHRFVDLIARATALRGTDAQGALELLDEGLSWWRGDPYQDLLDSDLGVVEAERLAEMRAVAREERLATLIAVGRAVDALPDLVALVAELPLRERPRSLLMTALHVTGRTADASRQYDELSRLLAEELGLEPSAGLRRLHDRIVRGESLDDAASPAPTTPPAMARSSPISSAIPASSSALIGRDDLIEQVASGLAEHRLVTLIGTGGVGKTRIAAEASRRLREAGVPVWFCELAPIDRASVEIFIAETMGVEERVGTDLLTRITDALRHDQGVIVLDNCEHVIDEAAAVAQAVLRECAGLRVLATSRERLAVDGEHLRPVAPFPLTESPSADDAAIRLFGERATAVRPDFVLDATTLSTVAQICRRLDGLPLAIELAAARLHAIELSDIAAGLDQRFRLLTSGVRTSTRQRSLAAAVSWSHDLLDPPTRAAFDALGVFAGPFDGGAAARVLGIADVEATELLVALVERSLVQRTGDGRFVLLETLKQWAVEQLQDSGRLDQLRRRHAAWALAEAQRCDTLLPTANDDAALRAIDLIVAELRAAHRFLVDTSDAESDLALVVALNDYSFFRMRPEVLGWAEDAARLGRAIDHPATADALAIAALGAWKRGDIDRSRELAEQGHTFTTERGLPDSCLVATELGVCGLATGDLDDARAWFDRAAKAADALNSDMQRILVSASDLLASAFGDYADAAALAETLLGSLPDGPTAVGSYAWYGAAEAVAGHDQQLAMQRARRALADADTTGAWFVSGVAGALVASIATRVGETDEAVQIYRWLLPWCRRSGEFSVLGTVLRSTAELLARLGRDRTAAVVLGSATTPNSGHNVFGADAQRLDQLAVELTERLGADVFAELLASGSQLDVDSAAAVAAAELDRLD